MISDERIAELAVEHDLTLGGLVAYEQTILAFARALLQEAGAGEPEGWQPIESAPKDGRILLLGYFNSHGNWRTIRGRWYSQEQIDEEWEDCDCFPAGWYEEAVEAEDVNCWPTDPTHWMPVPKPPEGDAVSVPAMLVEEGK